MATATRNRATGTRLSVRDLKAALVAVAPAVASRNVTPSILQCVRFDGGTVAATNRNLWIEVPCACELSCAIPHGRLLAIVNSCPQDADISLAIKGDSCAVACGGGRWLLPTEDESEFPTWDLGKTAAGLSLPADEMARAMLTVLPSVSKSVPSLSSVLVEVTPESGRFVASDGHRMAIAEIQHDLAVDGSATLLPADAALALAKLAAFAGDDAEALFRYTKTAVHVTVGTAELMCHQISGEFPNYRKVDAIPGDTSTAVDKAEFLAATKAAAVVTSLTSRGVSFAFTKDFVTISGRSAEFGSSNVSCPVLASLGTPEFVINPAYATGWIDSLPSDCEPQVEIDVIESRVVLRCGEYRTVIMTLAE